MLDVHVTTTISGEGYFDELVAPRVSEGSHFRVYEPRQIDRDDEATVFEQILIPQSTNAVAVPAISFSWFDPKAGAYRNLTRGPTRLSFHDADTERARPVGQYRPGHPETVDGRPALDLTELRAGPVEDPAMSRENASRILDPCIPLEL